MLSNHQDRTDTLDLLLNKISRLPVLDAQEERGLAILARQGSESAARRLACSNLGRVVRQARQFRNKGVPLEDLIGEGVIGLLNAARTFDPTRDVRFFTYAAFFVRRAMVAALSRGAKVVRVPRQVRTRVRNLRRRLDERSSLVGQEAALEEEAARLHVSPGALLSDLASSCPFEVSLESRPAGRSTRSHPSELESGEPAPEALALAVEREVEVRAAVALLPERDRGILSARFGLAGGEPETLRDVGGRLKLSKERVRQIEERAKGVIRARLELRLRAPGAGTVASGPA